MRKRIVYIICFVLVFLLGSSFNFVLIKFFFNPISGTTIKTVNEVKVEETMAEDAIAKVYDAVVVVENYKSNQLAGSGTGFIYKVDNNYAYIITNNHVVEGAEAVKVTLTSGTTVDTKVMGTDQYGDIAVLRIQKQDNLKVATISSTDSVKVGSTVFAIGSPIGSEYSGTITRGVVSGKDRMLPISINDSDTNDWIMRVIQTDAAINPGNSGGPLINLAGEVIGVTSLKLVDSKIEGIGFAIPVEDVMKYVNVLEKGEAIQRPVLGVSLIDVGDIYSLYYANITINNSIKSGVVIEQVVNDSSASKAGLQRGDVIINIGNYKVDNMAELRYELFKHNIGDKVKVTYIRGNETKTSEVTLIK